MRVVFQWLFCVSLASLVLGCGGGDNKPAEQIKVDLVPAAGIVTLDGKPLADATISFQFDGPPPKGFVASGAKSDSSGKFIVMTGSKSGTAPGRYKVTVSLLKMPDGSPVKATEPGLDVEMLRQGGQVKESIPERFSNPEITELSAAIPDDGVKDIELKLTGS
jgi:hypothetical protein